jgi:hypothetical protein
MSVEFQEKTKAVVTVAEMARMLGLSRARFYQLIGTALPYPIFDVRTRRPFYSEEQQRVCLEVRRRNCGIDGKPILFYARRGGTPSSPTSKSIKQKSKPNKELVAVIDAVRSLGLVNASADQIGSAIRVLFPRGIESVDQAEVIRGVFVHLQRQYRSDNFGR